MNQTSKSMEKKIRSVKTWLDRAEQAYADDSTAKGQLQLMLAKAEMKHLDEQQAKRKSYLRYAMYALTLSLTLLALYFALTSPNHVPKPVNDGKPAVTDTVNSTTNSSATGSATEQGKTVITTNDAVNSSSGASQSGTATSNAASSASGTTAVNNSTANASGDAGNIGTASTNESSVDESQTSGQTSVTETVSANQEERGSSEPVISNTQIQEAVREGGRSLRGQ